MADDLRARIAEALLTTPSMLLEPEEHARHAAIVRKRHDRHNYDSCCALCRGEADTLADAVLAVVQPEPYTPGGPLLTLMDRIWDSCADPDGREPRSSDERARLVWHLVRAEIESYLGQLRELGAERDRLRLAWQSARQRADCRTTVAQLEAERHTTRRVWDEYDLMKARAERAEAALNGAEINPVQPNTTTKE